MTVNQKRKLENVLQREFCVTKCVFSLIGMKIACCFTTIKPCSFSTCLPNYIIPIGIINEWLPIKLA